MRNEDEENANASHDNYDNETPSLIHPGLSARHMPTAGIADPDCRPQEDSPIVSLKALSPRREDPLAYIRDPKCYKASMTVLGAFMGSPQQKDSNLVTLQEAGFTLARRVFHPPEVTLVKSQKDVLKSDLKQDEHLKIYEKSHYFKSVFEFWI